MAKKRIDQIQPFQDIDDLKLYQDDISSAMKIIYAYGRIPLAPYEDIKEILQKAQKGGVEIAVITMDENSTIAKMAKVVVVLPGVSPKLKNKGISITSTQPMGSAFEQMMFLTYDGIIMELMDRMGQTSDEMFLRHADFE